VLDPLQLATSFISMQTAKSAYQQRTLRFKNEKCDYRKLYQGQLQLKASWEVFAAIQ